MGKGDLNRDERLESTVSGASWFEARASFPSFPDPSAGIWTRTPGISRERNRREEEAWPEEGHCAARGEFVCGRNLNSAFQSDPRWGVVFQLVWCFRLVWCFGHRTGWFSSEEKSTRDHCFRATAIGKKL
jgi:hypothetical protein